MVAPVKLIKSKLTNPATASAWLTVKLNVSDVSGVDAPPPPKFEYRVDAICKSHGTRNPKKGNQDQ